MTPLLSRLLSFKICFNSLTVELSSSFNVDEKSCSVGSRRILFPTINVVAVVVAAADRFGMMT